MNEIDKTLLQFLADQSGLVANSELDKQRLDRLVAQGLAVVVARESPSGSPILPIYLNHTARERNPQKAQIDLRMTGGLT
jgi:hypothetical protein